MAIFRGEGICMHFFRNRTYLFVFCLFMCIHNPLFAAVDSDSIMTRIRDYYFKSKPDAVAANLSSIQGDGSWTDINYDDRDNAGGWEPLTHLDRTLDFAMAYTMDPAYEGDEDIYRAVIDAMDYFYQSNPQGGNWWYNHIAAPKWIGRIFIYMRIGETPVPDTLETTYLERLDGLSNPEDYDLGANRVDIAMWHMYQALLRDSHEEMTHASEYLFNSLVYVTDGEGIMHDNSLHAHGPQLYDYGYGTVLLDGISLFAEFLAGSRYAMPVDYLDVFSGYLLGSYAASRRGQYVGFSPTGRSISRKNALYRHGAYLYDRAIRIDSVNAGKYQDIFDRSTGVFAPGDGISPVNEQFYRSNYMTHSRPEYTFTVRTSSKRTSKQESGNSENIKARFLTEGATNILVTGNEYYNIFPIWDWTKIPGVTVPAYDNLQPPFDWSFLGRSSFTGGVTSGSYGLFCFETNEFSTIVNKSWFCFDDAIVCLGSGLISISGRAVSTTVNQCWSAGEITVHKNNTLSVVDAQSLNAYPEGVEWIWHDSVGYFFPEKGNLMLSNQTQTGSWYDINNLQSSATVSGDVFTLWFDHGIRPENDTYAYMIMPGITDPDDMQNYDREHIEIIENSSRIQAMKHNGLDMIQAVFYEPGGLNVDGIIVKADQPCAMVLSNVSTSQVTVSISDPGESQSEINVYWSSPELSGLRKRACALPTEVARRGSTVTYEINEDTPGVKPIVIAGKMDDVGSAWETVILPETYLSPVVICAANYTEADAPAVVRLRNAYGNRFDLSVQNPGEETVLSGYTVHYAVFEEGVYTEAVNGIKLEAITFGTSVTDRNGSFSGESRPYVNAYTNPVVLGQVMTARDTAWSVFWAGGERRSDPPDGSNMTLGKHVGDDTNMLRQNEDIGYIVVEQGVDSIGGIAFTAGLGPLSVQGMGDAPPYTYTISHIPSAGIAVTGSAGPDTVDGGWPVLYGDNPVSNTSLHLAWDEDRIREPERSHKPDQVAYLVFEDISTGLEENGTEFSSYPGQLVLDQNYPNPFNPATTIRYSVGAYGDTPQPPQQIDLSIYNLVGQKVATLVSEKQSAGCYTVEWDAIGFASGVYYYKLTTDQGFTETRKLVLLR